MARQLEHFPNLVTMFFTRAAELGDRPFLWAKRGGAWQATSWAEAARIVSSLAAALKAHHEAHEKCFIANSVNFPIVVEPVFRTE